MPAMLFTKICFWYSTILQPWIRPFSFGWKFSNSLATSLPLRGLACIEMPPLADYLFIYLFIFVRGGGVCRQAMRGSEALSLCGKHTKKSECRHKIIAWQYVHLHSLFSADIHDKLGCPYRGIQRRQAEATVSYHAHPWVLTATSTAGT